ncbi:MULTISPECIES: segregation/condensation protein A [unclassified Leptolyngbya]|uniref:segregation/condensation protein A n=1 Tax=unclassified Leptolyngbya TaxID=2650499 RepID=UPI001683EB9E|nr:MULTISPECIES: segregation/condensation protein A [unclassified Leptolyngbya]MBD1911792.1 segregation/condensation protein A [Leptolyngbya sp. FACHB-8]MBD2153318.1 segregation/condensation protein A [Leptolyngbya sp. FACHB-16]
MALSLAQNAIALLIDLAEQGDIDPWDVKVIEVIDRFLSQLKPYQNPGGSRAAYEADLSESGQAFLYASMLVLLKADSLARQEAKQGEEENTEQLEDFLGDGALAEAPLPLSLERQIRRRATARPQQNRRVTLQELIAQLEVMATTVAEHTPRIKTRRPRPQSRNQAVRTIAQLAHQENLSEIAAALERFLQAEWDEICQGEDWMEFESLLGLWVESDLAKEIQQTSAHHSAQSDRVAVFWALLFLSAQSKVELGQDEFYKDLRVRSLENLPADALTNPPSFVLPD